VLSPRYDASNVDATPVNGVSAGESRPALSVVIPSYNEAARLRRTLDDVRAQTRHRSGATEIVVVDDGSTDGTADLVRRTREEAPEVRLLQLPSNQGKGAAVRAGMRDARGVRRAFIDADGAVPFEEIRRLEAALDQGADVAVGSRVLDPSLVEALAHRKFAGLVFRTWVKLLAVRSVEDTQCGFKLFTAGAADALFAVQLIPTFAFDVEVLARAERLGMRIAEVGVRWRDQPGSKVRVLHDGLAMAKDVLRIRRALGPW
jgi:dolichyl-phosphate beta-glucosyltransferase